MSCDGNVFPRMMGNLNGLSSRLVPENVLLLGGGANPCSMHVFGLLTRLELNESCQLSVLSLRKSEEHELSGLGGCGEETQIQRRVCQGVC